MTILYLSKAEKELYDAIDSLLKEGWDVEEETGEAYESDADLAMRYKIATFHENSSIHKLLKNVKPSTTPEEFQAIASSVDLLSFKEDQLLDIFFILGCRRLSAMIVYALQHAQSDEDVEGAMILSKIRHILFKANASSSLR